MGDRGDTVTIPEQHARCKGEVARHNGRVGQMFDAVDISGAVVFESAPYQAALDRVRRRESAGIVVGRRSCGPGRDRDVQ